MLLCYLKNKQKTHTRSFQPLTCLDLNYRQRTGVLLRGKRVRQLWSSVHATVAKRRNRKLPMQRMRAVQNERDYGAPSGQTLQPAPLPSGPQPVHAPHTPGRGGPAPDAAPDGAAAVLRVVVAAADASVPSDDSPASSPAQRVQGERQTPSSGLRHPSFNHCRN